MAARNTRNMSGQFHHRTVIQQGRFRDDDRAFDIAGGSHKWVEGPMLRQSREIDVLKGKHDVTDFNRIAAIAHDASERKIGLSKDDIHLPNFEIVRPERLLHFRSSFRIRHRSCGTNDLVTVSNRNSILGAPAKVDVFGIRRKDAQIVIELPDQPVKSCDTGSQPDEARTIQIVFLDLWHNSFRGQRKHGFPLRLGAGAGGGCGSDEAREPAGVPAQALAEVRVEAVLLR